MGLIKSEIFSTQQNEIANFTRLLAHPARIAILQYILEQKSCICNDLVNEIGLAQSTISQHLKELKNSGLIQGKIEGTSVCYCIAPEMWAKASATLSNFLNQIVLLNKNCC